MRPHVAAAIATALLLGSGASAQQPSSGAPKQPAAVAPASDVQPPGESEPRGQPVNVTLELTITDQIGPGDPAKKTVAMIVADRATGSIRSSGNNIRAVLNVDATPQILANGNLRVHLGLEYNPRQASNAPQTVKSQAGEVLQVPDLGGSSLNQRVTIVLEPGKPLVLSQAADPISDRRIMVEVRAAILK